MVQLTWEPQIAPGGQAIWRGLVDALAADIAGHVLTPGVRLPPQRMLAFRLGISVGTVARAYEEAERAGLVESHVGRGTFVSERNVHAPSRPQGPIDMARNVPPGSPARACIDDTLGRLRRRPDLAALADYAPTAGLQAVREAGARWLNDITGVERARADRLIQVNGGQSGLWLACSSFAHPGDTILCDAATYPGNTTMAAHGGWQLCRIGSDAEGMDAQALDRAAAESGARLLILIPTLHNPTTITLSRKRRDEIVEIARRRDLLIVEDDIYRMFGEDDSLPPLAQLAPERTIHVASLSKALTPGLRLAFVLPPDDRAIEERLLLGQQAGVYCPPAAGGLIFAQWMEDGTAARLFDEVRSEAGYRLTLARGILGAAMADPASARSLHVWLPMPGDRARTVASAAIRAGVEVTPPDAPFGRPEDVSGLRLCLGAPMDIEQVERGLRVVADALASGNGRARAIV